MMPVCLRIVPQGNGLHGYKVINHSYNAVPLKSINLCLSNDRDEDHPFPYVYRRGKDVLGLRLPGPMPAESSFNVGIDDGDVGNILISNEYWLEVTTRSDVVIESYKTKRKKGGKK